MTDSTHLSRRGFLSSSAAAGGGLVVASGLLTAGCSTTDPDTGGKKDEGNLLEKLKKQGHVTLGISGEAPYAYKRDGKLLGEAPTLHREIFHALGIKKLKPVQTDFKALIPGLNAGRWDVVSAGMAITPKRCEQAIFSNPEFIGPTALMVKKGNPKKLSDLESAKDADATLGVLQGAVEGGYAKDAGVEKSKIKTLAKPQDLVDALVADRIDAIALTGITLRWAAKASSNKNKPIEVLKPFLPVVDGEKQYSPGGAVFRSDATELRDAFNRELRKITSDQGRYVDLLGTYGFSKSEVPPADLKTADLCKA